MKQRLAGRDKRGRGGGTPARGAADSSARRSLQAECGLRLRDMGNRGFVASRDGDETEMTVKR